jgi:transcriptional regulator with XRE-family HTH domain
MNETETLVTNDPMANIGGRIKRVRESVPKRTQAEFAALIGVERGAVGNWELGKRPTLENLYQISKKTLVPMEWFMEGLDNLPIPFLDVAAGAIRTASDPALTQDEAVSIVATAFLALRPSIPEAEARIAARAVIRAYRKQPTPPKLSLSEEEKRSAVLEAIRLFLPE